MKKNRLVAMALAAVLALSTLFTGCGNSAPAANEVVASFGDVQITYGVANFYTKYQQVMYDSYYLAYMGETMWETDLGDGKTMFDSMKGDAIDGLEQIYRLNAHAEEYGVALTDEENAAIDAAAEAFMADNKQSGLDTIGASDVSIVKEYLRVYTVASRVQEKIVDETEITVTEEDAKSKTIRYIRVNTDSTTDEDGNTVEYDDAAKAALLEDLQVAAADLQAVVAGGLEVEASGDASGDVSAEEDAFAAKASELGYSPVTYSYAADETNLDAAVIAAVENMAEGQVSDVIEGSGYAYIVIYDSAYDAEASASYLEELKQGQKSEHYNAVYEAWQEETPITINEDVWAKVTLGKLFTLVSNESQE